LVVIAIVAILAALLLPALARAKEKARAVHCLSNVRQWAAAFWMYADDFDDFFPYEGQLGSISTGLNLNAWYNVTTVYAGQERLMDLYAHGDPPMGGSQSIFSCPSTARKLSAAPTMTNPYFMYGFNNRMDPNGSRQFKRAEVWQPTDTVTFTENSESRYPSTSGVYTPARHSLRAALGFADGHASLVHTNDYRRSIDEDDAKSDWSGSRTLYWFPFPTAPL
jgi:prepilin-type processing-associated H-X9-DG protein